MFAVELFSWWYGAGLRHRVALVAERLASTADYFSIGLLLKTLFSPFRQISAGVAGGSISERFRASVDRLISRAVGAVVRLCTVLAGIVCLAAVATFGVVEMLIWSFIPLIPFVGIALFFVGVTPSWS